MKSDRDEHARRILLLAGESTPAQNALRSDAIDWRALCDEDAFGLSERERGLFNLARCTALGLPVPFRYAIPLSDEDRAVVFGSELVADLQFTLPQRDGALRVVNEEPQTPSSDVLRTFAKQPWDREASAWSSLLPDIEAGVLKPEPGMPTESIVLQAMLRDVEREIERESRGRRQSAANPDDPTYGSVGSDEHLAGYDLRIDALQSEAAELRGRLAAMRSGSGAVTTSPPAPARPSRLPRLPRSAETAEAPTGAFAMHPAPRGATAGRAIMQATRLVGGVVLAIAGVVLAIAAASVRPSFTLYALSDQPVAVRCGTAIGETFSADQAEPPPVRTVVTNEVGLIDAVLDTADPDDPAWRAASTRHRRDVRCGEESQGWFRASIASIALLGGAGVYLLQAFFTEKLPSARKPFATP